jgi:hypothetical protein
MAGHFLLPEAVEAKAKASKKTSVPVEGAETPVPVSDENN